MTERLDQGWFTEVFDSHGSAFSLMIKDKLHEVQSPYQHLEVYATETYGNLMVDMQTGSEQRRDRARGIITMAMTPKARAKLQIRLSRTACWVLRNTGTMPVTT